MLHNYDSLLDNDMTSLHRIPHLLRLLGLRLSTPEAHAVNVHQTATQVRREHGSRQRDDTANQDVGIARHHTRVAPARPPVEGRTNHRYIVDDSV